MSETSSDDGGPNEEVVARADELVHREHPGQFTLKPKRGWRAVPLESSLHLSEGDVKRLTSAFRSLGALAVYAVALEMRGDIETVRRFPTSEVGLMSFNRAFSHFNYALTTYDCAALVVCTTDDYMVICGPESFVRLAVGKNLEPALEEFRQFAIDPWWPPAARKMFESVWSAFVTPGPVIVFPGWVAKGTS